MASDGVMVCTDQNCSHQAEQDRERAASFESTETQGDAEVIETDASSAFEGKPTAEVYCETCENDRAWYTIKQTASADEPPTRFFKCTACGHRWRDYN